MLVSILVAHYAGHEENLRRTLQSIRDQTYRTCEVIVADDGSVDESLPHWTHHLRLRPFGSASRSNWTALHEAYRRSSGDFVILTDADILVPPSAVQKMVDYLKFSGRIVPIVYGLSRFSIDDYPWQLSLDVLQQAHGFWMWTTPQGVYNIQAKTVKHHLLFCGARREVWDKSGLFAGGEVIPEHYMAKQGNILQLPVSVYHQWHSRGEQFSVRVQRIRDAQN